MNFDRERNRARMNHPDETLDGSWATPQIFKGPPKPALKAKAKPKPKKTVLDRRETMTGAEVFMARLTGGSKAKTTGKKAAVGGKKAAVRRKKSAVGAKQTFPVRTSRFAVSTERGSTNKGK